MSLSGESASVTKDTIGIFVLYALSYLLGVISAWIIIALPLSDSVVSLYDFLLAGGAFITIASAIGGAFWFLTHALVVNPLRERLRDATAEVESPAEPSNSAGGSEQIDVDTAVRTIRELGNEENEE